MMQLSKYRLSNRSGPTYHTTVVPREALVNKGVDKSAYGGYVVLNSYTKLVQTAQISPNFTWTIFYRP